jgi:hypothetical protein
MPVKTGGPYVAPTLVGIPDVAPTLVGIPGGGLQPACGEHLHDYNA